MSLDDVELLYVRIFWEFRVISQNWEATTAKRVNLNPYVRENKWHCGIMMRDLVVYERVSRWNSLVTLMSGRVLWGVAY